MAVVLDVDVDVPVVVLTVVGLRVFSLCVSPPALAWLSTIRVYGEDIASPCAALVARMRI